MDVWKNLLSAEQSVKMRNLQIEQNWKRLENRLGIMEMRLERAREVRDEYLSFLRNKYPSWQPPVYQFQKINYETRLLLPRELGPSPISFLDKLSTRKYWSLDPDTTLTSVSILRDLQSSSSATKKRAEFNSNQSVTDGKRTDETKEDFEATKRELREIRSDISWIKDRIREISLEIQRPNEIGHFPVGSENKQFPPASDRGSEITYLTEPKAGGNPRKDPEYNGSINRSLNNGEPERDFNGSSTYDKLPPPSPPRKNISSTEKHSNFAEQFPEPSENHPVPIVQQKESNQITASAPVPAERKTLQESKFDYKSMMGMIAQEKPIIETDNENSDSDSVEAQIASSFMKKKPVQTAADLSASASSDKLQSRVTQRNSKDYLSKQSSNASISSLATTKVGEEFLAKLFPEKYADSGEKQKGLAKPPSFFVSTNDSDSEVELTTRKRDAKDEDSDSDFFG